VNNYPATRKSAKGYTAETRELLLERLAACGSLRAVCKAADMPSAATVHVWLQEDTEFARAYARARAIGVQLFADETLEIADEKIAPQDVPAAKLRIETRRWLAERMLPKVYGAKTGVEMSGGLEVKKLSRTEVAVRVAALIAIAQKRKDDEDANGDLA
jgi:hypothetical protein